MLESGSNWQIVDAIRELRRLCPEDSDDTESPIFLLAAGWRSGSTLLQRLAMSNPNTLIWGEPYNECGVFQALARSVRAVRKDWPPKERIYDGSALQELKDRWVANLYPDPSALRRAHRSFFDALLKAPAMNSGATRWGMKEVRFSAEHALYLHWLYPKSRFVFLVRHPLEAYRSYSRSPTTWYWTYPDEPISTPLQFGRIWRSLAEGFLRTSSELPTLLIRYEDLISNNQVLKDLEQHLSIRIDATVLKHIVGSSKRKATPRMGAVERLRFQRAVKPVATALGYSW